MQLPPKRVTLPPPSSAHDSPMHSPCPLVRLCLCILESRRPSPQPISCTLTDVLQPPPCRSAVDADPSGTHERRRNINACSGGGTRCVVLHSPFPHVPTVSMPCTHRFHCSSPNYGASTQQLARVLHCTLPPRRATHLCNGDFFASPRIQRRSLAVACHGLQDTRHGEPVIRCSKSPSHLRYSLSWPQRPSH